MLASRSSSTQKHLLSNITHLPTWTYPCEPRFNTCCCSLSLSLPLSISLSLSACGGQIPTVPHRSRAAFKLFETPHGDCARQSVGGIPGRITSRSAAVTRFMSAVPESGRLQLPVSGVLRTESGFSPIRGVGAWVESSSGPFSGPDFNCIDAPSHPALGQQFHASQNRTLERVTSIEPATRLLRCARVRGQYQASSPR